MKKGRNKHLVNLRNQAMVARYFYWSEIWQRRYEVVLHTLSTKEFFIAETTIQDQLSLNDHYLCSLRRRNPSIRELECEFPGFSWKESLRANLTKNQIILELK